MLRSVLYISAVIFTFHLNSFLIKNVEANADFLILHQLYGQKKLIVEFDFKKIDIDPENVEEIELELIRSDKGEVVEQYKSKQISFSKPKKFVSVFNMKDVQSGIYQLNAKVKDTQGVLWNKEFIKEFSWLPKELEKFKWLNSKEGITDEVLAPWTPIEVEKQKEGGGLIIKVWGRSYKFDNSPFPTSIETKGNFILAKPIKIIAKVDGENVPLEWKPFKIERQTPGIVSFTQAGTGGGLNLSAVTQIEYDGMIRIDWKVTSEKVLKLEELIFEIPISDKYAKYIYMNGYSFRNGFIPKSRLLMTFKPMIWLGDEECGLQWFCESENDWYNTRSGKCIEILLEDNVVKLRLHVVDKEINMYSDKVDYRINIPVMEPVDNVSELSYTFGLHATPVKPVRKDVWDYRIHHVGHVKSTTGTGERFTNLLKPGGYYNLDELTKAGVKTIAFHAHWTDYYGSTSTPYKEDLKRLVEECHKRGIQLLLYLGFMMSELDPAWSFFNEECLMLCPNPNEWDYTKRDTSPMPQQKFYDTCWRSVWQNYYADGVKRMMMEYGIDGVYLDSTDLVFGGCENTLHGCGFIKPNGKIGKTFSIFPNREMMRRIYTIVKHHRPDGQVNLHNSTQVFASTMSFATSYWDGEHLGTVLVNRGLSKESPILEQMPLDYFRAEFMGHQWGVPAEFLDGYIFPNPTVTIGVSLLHDVLVRGAVNQTLWKLSDEFGRKEAEWLPYWRNKEYVSIKPEGKDVYVSLYKHPKNGVLVVVANLSEKEEKVKIKINLEKLQIKKISDKIIYEGNPLLAYDINMTDDVFELNLKSGEFKIIWVKEI